MTPGLSISRSVLNSPKKATENDPNLQPLCLNIVGFGSSPIITPRVVFFISPNSMIFTEKLALVSRIFTTR